MNTQKEPNTHNLLRPGTFSHWLGIEILELNAGYCRLSMKVRPEMMNALQICHGGVIFSLADTAVGFAANSRGSTSVGLVNTINFLRKVSPGDVLTAETKEQHNGSKTAIYDVTIANQAGQKVAVLRGTAFRL